MKKRILAILLSAIMIASLMPTVAFAAKTPITAVELTVGEYTTTEAFPAVTAPAGANYEAEIEEIYFSDDSDLKYCCSPAKGGGLAWDEFGVDEEGHMELTTLENAPDVSGLTAYFMIACRAKEDYSFDEHEQIPVTVNSKTINVSDESGLEEGWAWDGSDLINIIFSTVVPSAGEPVAVTSVNVNWTSPAAGTTVNELFASLTDYLTYTDSASKGTIVSDWLAVTDIEAVKELDSTDALESGKTYAIVLGYSLPEGYYYDNEVKYDETEKEYSFDYSGKLTATITGFDSIYEQKVGKKGLDRANNTYSYEIPKTDANAIQITGLFTIGAAVAHTHGTGDDAITFTAWTDATKLPDTAGNYYLDTDVTLSATWNVPAGTEQSPAVTNLCLNGHVIQQTAADKNVITVPQYAVLNLYDCDTKTEHKFGESSDVWTWNDALTGTAIKHTVTGGVITGGNAGGVDIKGSLVMYGGAIVGNTTDLGGGGVYIGGSSSFVMNGGTIAGNSAGDSKGGGVYISNKSSSFVMNGGEIVDNTTNTSSGGGGVGFNGGSNGGSFTMTGGTITGNSAPGGVGGGVTLQGNCSFTMTGGTITGNSAKRNGGGVTIYNTGGSMTIGGTAKIYGNVNNSESCDLYLPTDKTITLGEGDGEGKNGVAVPADGMNVGVTMQAGKGAFTTNGTAGQEDFFFANDAVAYVPAYNEGKLVLQDRPAHTHDDITFKPWNKTDSLPTTEGNWYLMNDVTLTETWNVPKGTSSAVKTTNLCLNGCVIKAAADMKAKVITVPQYAVLNLYDCDTKTEHYFAVGGDGLWTLLDAETDGCKTVTGGVITGGNVTLNCAGVSVSGSFTMNGGTICGNTTTKNGGGVYISSGGSFTMSGGSITGNTASGNGGGACLSNGSMTIGGTAKIYGNVCKSESSDLYLYTDKTITLGEGDGEGKNGVAVPADGMNVGVTMVSNTGAFTTNGTKDDAGYFFADKAGQSVIFKTDHLELVNVYDVTNGAPSESENDNHGYLTIDKTTAIAGETVTVTATPAEGYKLKSLTVTYHLDGENTIIPVQDAQDTTKYTFTIPYADVTVTAEFGKVPSVADIIPEGFPTTEETGWVNENGLKCYYASNVLSCGGAAINSAWDFASFDVTGNIVIKLSASGKIVSFTLILNENGKLSSIVIEGFALVSQSFASVDGTYAPAQAEEKTFDFITIEGYQVRTEGYNGLRSLFKVDESKFPTIEKDGYELLEYGTLYAASEILEKRGDKLVIDGTTFECEDYMKQLVIYRAGEVEREHKDFFCTVINFNADTYARNISSRAYAILKDAKGDKIVVYFDYANEEYRSVSLEQITNALFEARQIDETCISYSDIVKFKKEKNKDYEIKSEEII